MPQTSTPKNDKNAPQGDLFAQASTPTPGPPAQGPVPPRPSAWLPAPELALSAPKPGASPLMLAAELNHTELASKLLATPIEWDLTERYGHGGESEERRVSGNSQLKGHGALALLLRRRSEHAYNSESKHTGNENQVVSLALELVRRGADFLVRSDAGQSALGLALDHNRQTFFTALIGHPRFSFDLIASERCVGHAQHGHLPATKDTDLLTRALNSDRVTAAEALIKGARWPINAPLPNGRLPLSLAQSPFMCQTLLALGADALAKDASGLTAMDHSSNIGDTTARNAIISALSAAMRKGSTGTELEALRQANIPALFESARENPKSSFLKSVAAFKFNIKEVREPETGISLLCAALEGGRIASAMHCLDAGNQWSDLDARGRPAFCWLLLGLASNPSQLHVGLWKEHQGRVDWSWRAPNGDNPLTVAAELHSKIQPEKAEGLLGTLSGGMSVNPALATHPDPERGLARLLFESNKRVSQAWIAWPEANSILNLCERDKTLQSLDAALAFAAEARKGSWTEHYRAGFLQNLSELTHKRGSELGSHAFPLTSAALRAREPGTLQAELPKQHQDLMPIFESIALRAELASASGPKGKPGKPAQRL